MTKAAYATADYNMMLAPTTSSAGFKKGSGPDNKEPQNLTRKCRIVHMSSAHGGAIKTSYNSTPLPIDWILPCYEPGILTVLPSSARPGAQGLESRRFTASCNKLVWGTPLLQAGKEIHVRPFFILFGLPCYFGGW